MTGTTQVYPGTLGNSSEKIMLLAELSRALGLRVSRVTRTWAGQYRIELGDGRAIVLRNLAALQSQRRFNCAVAGKLNQLIPHFRRAEWDRVVSLLLTAVEPEVTL